MGSGATHLHARQRPARVAVAATNAARESSTPVDLSMRLRDLFGATDWSLSFIGLLAYVFSVVSYALPLGRPAIIVALLALPLQRHGIRLPAFVVLLGLVAGWGYLSAFSSAWPEAARRGAEQLLIVSTVAFVAVNAVRTASQARFLILFLLATVALYPVRGALANYLIYGEAPGGRVAWNYIYSNPNDLAALLLFPLGLCIFVWQGALKKRWAAWCALAGAILVPFVIFLSGSRGAMLGLLFLIGTVFLAGRRKLQMLLVAATAALLVVFLAPSTALERFLQIGQLGTNEQQLAEVEDLGSARQRYEVWRVARRVIAEHPLTGVGPGVYPVAHLATSRRAEFDRTAWGARDAHSTYITAIAELGAPGALFFFGSVLSALLAVERRRRKVGRSHPRLAHQILLLELGFVSFLVACAFGSFNSVALFYLYLATMYASGVAMTDGVLAATGITVPRALRSRATMLRPSAR
jgi:putative inorganic carbon (HCO3(-)) transporter